LGWGCEYTYTGSQKESPLIADRLPARDNRYGFNRNCRAPRDVNLSSEAQSGNIAYKNSVITEAIMCLNAQTFWFILLVNFELNVVLRSKLKRLISIASQIYHRQADGDSPMRVPYKSYLVCTSLIKRRLHIK